MIFLKFKNEKGGFTLIELMIVVAIIGILAAIAIPNVVSYFKKAKTAEAKQFLSTMRTLEEAYRAENDTYSSSLTAIGWTAPDNAKYYDTYSITSATTTGFTARVSGNIDSDSATDAWTINQAGTLTHASVD
jgi:prepilin-type N-terminal cleavage/methylation domain-containing protein